MPRISVIIPTYNRQAFVIKAVQSALEQSFEDREVIVVDDGSTDNTRSVLECFGDKIRYVYQANAGVSAARNRGIEVARGEWLAFLDSDDEWTKEYLARQVANAGQVPGVCMQTTDCRFVGAKGERMTYYALNGALAEFKGRDYFLVREPFRFIVEHGPWQVGAMIVRAEAIRKAGLFDVTLRISEDFDLMARVALQGALGLIREPLVNKFWRDGTIECLSKQAGSKHARESDERMYQKLASIEGLRPAERSSLHRLMSSNRRAIGNLLLQEGRRKEAQECYRRALLQHLSIQSLGKYVLGFAPVRFGRALISN